MASKTTALDNSTGRTTGAPANGGPDWGLAFAEFHLRHRDVKGKKLVYSAIFNAAMEAFIACPEVPMVWRVLAWIWRSSWGNSSDFCVDRIGGSPAGQQACADHFGVKKQRVHDCVALLRELNFILPPDGHKLYPVDDPTRITPKDDNSEESKSPVPSGLFSEFCEEWKVRSLADFQELESAEDKVNRIKKDRLEEYRKWRRARSNHAQPIKPQQPITETTTSSSSAVVSIPGEGEKAEEEDRSAYQQFKENYPEGHFDEHKAKPSFEKKTKPEQRRILERLQIYLTCDRWQDAGGQWIPFASKWLESYDADPPPLLKKANSKSDRRAAADAFFAGVES